MVLSAAVGKVIGNNKGSVQNFGIVGITITLEEFSQFVFFYCPCDYPSNKLYGSIFMWGPAVVLLVVGFLAHRRTWRLTTGICNRTQGVGKDGKRIIHFINIFFQIFTKAVLAPATWVVLAFLKGDYYACAQWPDPYDTVHAREVHHLAPSNLTLPRPCMFNSNPLKFDASEKEIIARNLRAQSHVIGWMYLCIALSCGVVVMLVSRCWSKFSYEQSNYIARYRSKEIEIFEDQLDAKAKDKAEDVVTQWFSQPRTKLDWDKIAVINDKVSKSKRGKPIYSPLHNFVNKELVAKNLLSNVPDLVSDAAPDVADTGFASKFKKSGKPASNPAVLVPMSTGGGTTVKTVMPRKPPIEMKEGTFSDEKKPEQDKIISNHVIAADSAHNDTVQNGNSAAPNGNGNGHAPQVETPDSEQSAEDVKETSLLDDEDIDDSTLPLLEGDEQDCV